jgi:hypothetical protein
VLDPNTKNDMGMRRLVYIGGQQHLEGYELSVGAKTAFRSYQTAHAMDLEQSDSCDKYHIPGLVRINERGNLCENLPALAFTCHQVPSELWGYYFAPLEDNIKAHHTRYEVRVKNFDFFPMFRFFQTLHSTAKVQVEGHKVDIILRMTSTSKLPAPPNTTRSKS